METAKLPPGVVKLHWPSQLGSGLQSVGLTPIAIVFGMGLAIAPLFVRDEYTLRLLASLLFGAQAMAFDANVGYINVVNFGFAAFVGLGAYTSALMATRLGLSPWLGLLAGPIVAGALGFVTGVLTLRLRGIYAAVMAYIGGRGSIWGGLVAAFLVIPIFESLKSLFEIRLIIYGLFLILTMIFYPGGLAGIVNSLAAWARRRVRRSDQV